MVNQQVKLLQKNHKKIGLFYIIFPKKYKNVKIKLVEDMWGP